MENQTATPLEEITWRSPQHVQAMGGFLHSNNILFYFAESPFFDATSNNASLAIQAIHNENLRHFIETREAFEGRLKTMQGVEFVVAHDPLQELAAEIAGGGPPREPSNVWVIRKQMRTKRPGLEDNVQILATYFVVGDFIYMAPSVLSVVGRRMLSAVTSLTKALSTSSPLVMFSPAHGHTYMPPATQSLETSQLNQEPVQQSKEATPVPGAAATAAATATSKSADTSTSRLSAAEAQGRQDLEDALKLLARWGDEYMDENPLIGEPGAFIFSQNPAAASAANPDRVSSTASGGSAAAQPTKAASATPAPGSTAPTPALRTDAATLGAGKKVDKGGEQTPSPDTPGGSGGKEKVKRSKSKTGLPSS
ncbi:hypothetical protein VTO42DRAFT_6161 [Malbranchea cinnamomea]